MGKKVEDYNERFWKIWGVNHKVFKPLDVFNTERDKQSDEKSYNRFLNSNNLLSNEEYLYQLNLETYNFYDFFIAHLLGNTPQSLLYVKQLLYINTNYKMFKLMKLNEEKYINLFSFQIALIIENMNLTNIDISLFENSIKNSSIMPFINKAIENNKVKSLKDLALEFSYKNSEMKEAYTKHDVNIDDLHQSTLQKELSKWKNNKALPSFIKMILILNCIEKGNSERKTGYFFQLLIIRAFLYIQKEYSIKEDIKKKFFQKLSKFRKMIKNNYSAKEELKIYEEQLKYVIVTPNFFEDKELNLNEVLNQTNFNMKKYLEYNFDKDEQLDIKLPNKQNYIDEFNQCNSKESYLKLLEKIIDLPDDIPNYQFYNNGYNLIRFIIAIKVEDQRLFTKQFKYLDRGFGTLLSNGGIENNLSKFIEILKTKTELTECVNLIGEYIKKLSTLE